MPPLPPQYDHMMEATTIVTPSADAMLRTERAENDEAVCYYYRSSISCFPKAIR